MLTWRQVFGSSPSSEYHIEKSKNNAENNHGYKKHFDRILVAFSSRISCQGKLHPYMKCQDRSDGFSTQDTGGRRMPVRHLMGPLPHT